jgi:kumamolisin
MYCRVLGALVTASLLATPATADAAATQVRVGSAAVLPAGSALGGALPATAPMQLTVALAPQAGLAAYAQAVSTPGNPLYGRFLTVAQFAQLFGAPAAAVDAVEGSLRADGLSVGSVTANKLMLPVSGSAAEVERAFSVPLAQVRVAGRTTYANTAAPSMPGAFAPYVSAVIGLDGAAADRPLGLTAKPQVSSNGGPQPCPLATHATGQGQTTPPPAGYTADQIADMYGFNNLYGSGDFGAGQSVALFEEEPTQASDITDYLNCYFPAQPAPDSITYENVDGGPGPYNGPATSDDTESALDIEQIIGLAPQASIIVYQAPSAQRSSADMLNQMVADDKAKVLSSSWGLCEQYAGNALIGAENVILQEAATQGQTMLLAAGDTGAATCWQATPGTTATDTELSVIDPGSQPYATSVGGTFLGNAGPHGTYTLPTDGTYPGETVWNDGPQQGGAPEAGGGGVSSQWQMPSYQANAAASLGIIGPNSSGAPCTAPPGGYCREVPDVAADADPTSGYVVEDNANGSQQNWEVIGGTSAAAPLWAAFAALANDLPACRGMTLGFMNPLLYQVAGAAYGANFHDVTGAGLGGFANNDGFGGTSAGNPSQLYPVGSGYDMASGLGTPIAGQLAQSLCQARAPVYTVSLANPGPQTAPVGKPFALLLSGSDSGAAKGATLTYSATGLPAGLAIAPNGAITGAPAAIGAATVTVTAGDEYQNSSTTAFVINVVKPLPPTAGHASLAGVGSNRAKAKVTVAAGAYAPAIKSVVIGFPSGIALARTAKLIKQGIATGGHAYTYLVKGRAITITFTTPVTSASVSVGFPATVVSSSLETRVRRHKTRKLTLAFRIVDAAGVSSASSTAVKV